MNYNFLPSQFEWLRSPASHLRRYLENLIELGSDFDFLATDWSYFANIWSSATAVVVQYALCLLIASINYWNIINIFKHYR